MAVLKDRLSTGRSIAKYRCVLYQQRVDGASTLKGSSRVYLVVYNIEGPNLPSIIPTIFSLKISRSGYAYKGHDEFGID